jgi:hypothetical protein
MSSLSPNALVLRCYGHPTKEGRWYGVCLEFNLAAEAESPEGLKYKLKGIIESYINTVIDTKDTDSIPLLLSRRAPVRDYLTYYGIKFLHTLSKFPGNFIFKESVPFHLSKSCC